MAPDRLRAFIAEVYENGFVLDESGNEVSLEPDAIPRDRGEALCEFAIAQGAARTLEVGLGIGLATLFLCDAVIASGEPDARHVTIDRFQREHYGNAGVRVIHEAGCDELVTFLREDSRTALPRLAHEGDHFDLVFIDGDHRFESVFLDIYFAGLLIPAGATIVVDDTWMKPVRLAVSYFERNLGFELRTDTMPDALRWRRRRRLLGRRASWHGTVALLRKPMKPPERTWRSFEPFWD